MESIFEGLTGKMSITFLAVMIVICCFGPIICILWESYSIDYKKHVMYCLQTLENVTITLTGLLLIPWLWLLSGCDIEFAKALLVISTMPLQKPN